MAVVKVGELYHPDRTSWPESPQIRITEGGIELLLLYRDPTPQEIDSVRSGRVKFGWIDAGHAAVLAFRIAPGLPWSDAPYTPHREHQSDVPGIPTDERNTQRLVMVVLVDANTGVVKAIRATTWPARMVGAVGATIDRMLAAPFDPVAHDDAINRLYSQYARTDDLVRERADIVCTGGAPEGNRDN